MYLVIVYVMLLLQLDVIGECETKYVIKTDASGERSSVSEMVVSKVKNFGNCLAKNSFDQGLFAHLPHYSSEKVSVIFAHLLKYR